MAKTNIVTRVVGLAIASLMLGCGAADTELDEPTLGVSSAELEVDLTLTPFDDTVKPYADQFRNVIKSASEYEYYIGHAPPSGIDFSKEWVAFATTGTKPTDGYQLYIDRVRFFTYYGYNLYIYFREVAPGAGCAVNSTPSQVNALATFPIPPYNPRRTRFQNTYEVVDCPNP